VVQQVAHSDPIVDQQQFVAEHLPDRQIEVDGSVDSGRQHAERSEGLGAAGDPEAMLDRVRNTVGAIGEAIGMSAQFGVALDPDHPTERMLSGKAIDLRFHPMILPDVPSTMIALSAMSERTVPAPRPSSGLCRSGGEGGLDEFGEGGRVDGGEVWEVEATFRFVELAEAGDSGLVGDVEAVDG
jgi:hypothetical protein